MIFGNFDNLNNSGVPAVIQTLIQNHNLSVERFSEMEEGLYSLEDSGITYLVKAFTTDFKDQRPAEFHQQFVDLQLVIKGCETIYFDHSNEAYRTVANPKPDVYLVDPTGMSNQVELREGDFAIFLTHEPHQALCSELGQQAVKKVVFKIPKQLLNS